MIVYIVPIAVEPVDVVTCRQLDYCQGCQVEISVAVRHGHDVP